jgi:sugar lactone lactonase YvrE
VVTQGLSGQDFQLVSSNCTGSFTQGNTCTATVTFSPQAPGLRLGALELINGTIVGSQQLYGIGEGAVAALTPVAPTIEDTGSYSLSGPIGVAVDQAGDVFIADTANARVVEVAANGNASTVGVNLGGPQAVAIDGAGNLFIADPILAAVVEVPYGCTQLSCQVTVPNTFNLVTQSGVAIDGAGDLFISDDSDAKVVEVPANGGPQVLVYAPNISQTPPPSPAGLAADAAGDLFIADAGLKEVIEIPAGCTTSACQTTIGTGWSFPDSVSLDAAGDVYVADTDLLAVIEVPVGCTNAGCRSVWRTTPHPQWVRVLILSAQR